MEASLAAGVTLFDTAAMYSRGASERRLGELSTRQGGSDRHQVPAGLSPARKICRRRWRPAWPGWGADSSICTSITSPPTRVSIPQLMELMADAVEAGKVKAVGVSNYSADQMRDGACGAGRSAAFHWRPTRWSIRCCTASRR